MCVAKRSAHSGTYFFVPLSYLLVQEVQAYEVQILNIHNLLFLFYEYATLLLTVHHLNVHDIKAKDVKQKLRQEQHLLQP